MTEQELREILLAQMDAIKQLRNQVWSMQFYLQRTGVINKTEYFAFRGELKSHFEAGDEIAELERLYGSSPDDPSTRIS